LALNDEQREAQLDLQLGRPAGFHGNDDDLRR